MSNLIGHVGPPRRLHGPHPRVALMHHGRGFAAGIMRRWWNIEQYGAEHMPAHGPVIVASNHISFIDGPLLSIVGPRPVHSLTKVEMFRGPMAGFLHLTGQIPVARDVADITAVRISLAVLRRGGVLGVFPEAGRGAGDLATMRGGAAYFALVTGAPVVPLIYLGTRPTGAPITAISPRGARLAMTFGPALRFDPQPWPRRKADVREVTGQIRNAMLATLRSAEDATGMTLPGPAPDGVIEE
jgi:1-acyl-sn-glycerol-3-phosphate acyltransferase